MSDRDHVTREELARSLTGAQRQRIIAGRLAEGDVAALRRFVCLTQEQFAQALGISIHTLRNWEQNRVVPDGPGLALLRIAARQPGVLRKNLDSVERREPTHAATELRDEESPSSDRQDGSVAWIFGAGFSAPLGAPLLTDLITPTMVENFRHWADFGMSAAPGAVSTDIEPVRRASVVCSLYEAGKHAGPTHMWSDAETFLDCLDLATRSGGTLASRVLNLVGVSNESSDAKAAKYLATDIALVRNEAVRFVAAACTQFLIEAETNPQDLVDKSEMWDPYVRWAKQLKVEDAVLTFNYDRTLDLLERYMPGGRFGSWIRDRRVESNPSKRVKVFHLHGHVGWIRKNDSGESQDLDLTHAPNNGVAHIFPEQAVLGMPGLGKRELAEGGLKEVWDQAKAVIERARVVVFVGYRFPPSDNFAKRELLDALKLNPTATVHVVLGPQSTDASRLKEMIDWRRRGEASAVHIHNMWTQDFFAVFDRQSLVEALASDSRRDFKLGDTRRPANLSAADGRP